jgi:DNA repair exonuclease SbcCD ATPase subunit
MGLFSRKSKDQTPTPPPESLAEPDAVDVAGELEMLKQRLAASEQARGELEARLAGLDALETRVASLGETSTQLDARLGALDAGVTTLGEQLSELSATNARLDQRLVAVDELDARVRELTERSITPPVPPPPATSAPPPPPSTPTTPPPPPPSTSTPTPPPPPAHDDGEELRDEMAAQLADLSAAVALHTEEMEAAQQRLAEIDELAARIDRDDDATDDITPLRAQLDSITDQQAAMDDRITSVSIELANQLTELSRDIDELNRRNAEPDVGEQTAVDTAELEARLAERLEAAIDDVMTSTERLAAEQARYEIQFRADLAELAERLRRS